MSRALRRSAAILLALGLFPTAVQAQIGGLGPGGRVGLGGFGAVGGGFGGPGGFNVVNGFGPVGDSRILPFSQPLLSVYNGQTSLLQVQGFQWFPVNVQVVQNGGAVAFVPQYQPLPAGQSWPIQATQSPNGINRLSVAPTINNAGLGPLFPITTFITPNFAGGAQGQPVPFTQFIGQPGLNTVGLNTTVAVPDGGNAFLGRFGGQGAGRNAFGAPGLGGVPGMAPFFNNLNFGQNMNLIPVGAPRVFVP